MNIKDIKDKPQEGDKLDNIFATQRNLVKKYHPIETSKGIPAPSPPLNLHNCLHQQRLKDLAFRCISELIEATECLKNKPWKLTEVKTDVDHFYEEIADALHFLIEFCINAGIDSNMLYDLYFRKSEVNRFRVRSNY